MWRWWPAATDKARQSEAYFTLSEGERGWIEQAVNELLVVYHGEDHNLIRAKIDALDAATRKLAESIMNTAVGRMLKGTKL